MIPAFSEADLRPHRFAFGQNWSVYLAAVDENRIGEAERSLQEMLGRRDLAGKTLIDIGCGSGLFSLASRRLGARVHSIDLDHDSIACAKALKKRFRPDDPDWTIVRASVLDAAFMESLGHFDIVYSWGVLHHTGAMWQGLEHATRMVGPGGQLFIALYNDQGWASGVWRGVKWTYNVLPRSLRFVVLWPAFVRLWGPTVIRDLIRGRGFATWNSYARNRGMSPWTNVIDWVGGYPFEVARPDAVAAFCRERNLHLTTSRLCGRGHGCNEFLFTSGAAA